MNDELEVQLTEEDCDDEQCGGCGEMHAPVDLDKVLKKQKRWYRAAVAAYFGSLIATAYCVYELLGGWGAGAFISAFGAYFFHLNMTGMVRMLMTLEQASFGAIMAGKQAEKTEDDTYGNYA